MHTVDSKEYTKIKDVYQAICELIEVLFKNKGY